METIYSRLMPYMTPIPVDKSSVRAIEGQFFWREKLETIGYVSTSGDPKTDYRSIYKSLYNNAFDINKAYTDMCKVGNMTAVVFFEPYLSEDEIEDSHEECIMATSSKDIINTVLLKRDKDIDQALLSSIDSEDKMKVMLKLYNPDRIAAELITKSDDKVGMLVAMFISNEIVPDIAPLAMTHNVGLKFEYRGYIYSYEKALKLRLPFSFTRWLETSPPQDELKLALSKAIKIKPTCEECLRIIISVIEFDLSSFFSYAAKEDNITASRIFLNLGLDSNIPLIEAIKANSINVSKLLAIFSQDNHFRLSSSLGRVDIYNILLS